MEGREIPWDEVEVQFLGLTDLGAFQEDVELRWRVASPRRELGIFPVFGFGNRSLLDIVEFAVTRSEGFADVRVRMAHGDRFPSDLAGVVTSNSVGLRLLGSSVTWDIEMRSVVTTAGLAVEPRELTFDGALHLELVAAPDVRQDIGGWLLQAGTDYGLRYRIHNRTDADQEVHIRVDVNEEFARVDPLADGPISIPAGAAVELPLVLRMGEEIGGCVACLRVTVGYTESAPFSDRVVLDAEVVVASPPPE